MDECDEALHNLFRCVWNLLLTLPAGARNRVGGGDLLCDLVDWVQDDWGVREYASTATSINASVRTLGPAQAGCNPH